MAKLNVNMATREELVEAAGLRPDLAEAILKFRGKHGGKITDVNALEELPGVGPATIEQLRKALDFSERKTGGQNGQGESAGNGNERAAQESTHAARETAVRLRPPSRLPARPSPWRRGRSPALPARCRCRRSHPGRSGLRSSAR